jgi:hypothetical protein
MEEAKHVFTVPKGRTYHITHFTNSMPDTDYFIYSNTDVPCTITNKGTGGFALSFDEPLEQDVLFAVFDTLIPEPEIKDYFDHIKEEPDMLQPAHVLTNYRYTGVAVHDYTDVLTDAQHAFLPPLDIDERSDQYGWEYPMDSSPFVINTTPEHGSIDILEKVAAFEKSIAEIKSDLDEIKEAIMAINRKMDRY